MGTQPIIASIFRRVAQMCVSPDFLLATGLLSARLPEPSNVKILTGIVNSCIDSRLKEYKAQETTYHGHQDML